MLRSLGHRYRYVAVLHLYTHFPALGYVNPNHASGNMTVNRYTPLYRVITVFLYKHFLTSTYVRNP